MDSPHNAAGASIMTATTAPGPSLVPHNVFKELAEEQRILLNKPWWHPLTLQRRYDNFRYRCLKFIEKVIRRLWFVTAGRWLFLKRLREPYSETPTIAFVRKNTTIPVPRVLCVVRWRGSRWAVMARVRGRRLNLYLWKSMDNDHQNSIVAQLKNMVVQMRAIPPPPSPAICSVIGGPLFDLRLCTFEPLMYRDEEELNLQLREGLSLDHAHRLSPAWDSTMQADLVRSHSIRHRLVFTHADIALWNIMVEGSKVTALIDWEMSGWYPEHWEYLKARINARGDASIVDRLPEFIPPFEFEAMVDRRFGWGKWREAHI